MTIFYPKLDTPKFDAIKALAEDLHVACYATYKTPNKSDFLHYASNDCDYDNIVQDLSHGTILSLRPGLRVAIVIGESKLQSMLPELLNYADLVIVNDINPQLHKQVSHLITGLRRSSSGDEYREFYRKKHPMPDTFVDKEQKILLADTIVEPNENFILEHHFLFSDERFAACRKAAYQLGFVQTNVDVFDVKQWHAFLSMISKHQATVTLLNLTNIHDYGNIQQMIELVEQLLSEAQSIKVLYSMKGCNTWDSQSTRINDSFTADGIRNYALLHSSDVIPSGIY